MKDKNNAFFWDHPLAYWLQDCALGDPPLIPETEWRLEHRYNCEEIHLEEILDGFLMTSLMKYMFFVNPWVTSQLFSGLVPYLVFSILNILLVILKERENSQEELKKLLLLLLGCAIQSDKKKVFVERITGFNQEIQAGLARYIQQLTESNQIVKSLEDYTDMKDREDLVGGGGGVSGSVEDMDSDDLESTTTTSSNGEVCTKQKDQSFLMSRSTSPTSEARHLTLQVANLQHEMRQMRTQAENKDEECSKLEIELEEKSRKICALENERLKYLEKERKNKELTDDLQAARCRIEKLQPLENIEKKYKESKDEKEMWKSKYEAINNKNKILEEELTELEKNYKSLQLENKNSNTMEQQVARLKDNLKNLESEISKKNSDIEDLLVEKHRMSLELKEREERIVQLEVPSTHNTPRFMDSLADQLEDAKQDEVEMMKAEIRKLRAQTEGATPDTTLVSHQVDLDDLRKQIATEQHKNAQLQLEIQKLQVEREQIDGNMERIGIELEETSVQVENLSMERDEAVKQLHEARRKFGQFQTEFGVKSDENLRKFQLEIENMKEKEEEMECHVGKVKEENRRLQFELDEVHEEKMQIEEALKSLERSKRNLDLEKSGLKSRLLELEDQMEAQKLALLNSGVSQKRLEDRDTLINSLHNQKNDLENDLKTCQTHLELESKKLQRLREDLVQEKSKRADLVGRLRSLCTTLSLNGAQFEIEGMDDEQLIDNIDDIMMNALVAVKRERDDLRIQGNQQIAELSDLKRDIEKLRRCESASLNESDDRVRELTKENMHAKEQIFMLQEKLRELGLELSTKNKEIDIVKASIEESNKNSSSSSANNAEIARLQVSLRNSQIQEDLVKQENSKMRVEILDLQKQLKKKSQDLDELESMHKTLLVDHSRLQQLHNLLTRDYDEAKKESQELRQKVQNIPRQQAVFMNANIRELEAKLSDEISRREAQTRQFLDLEKEHKMCRIHCDNLRREVNELLQTREELSSDLHRALDTCAHRNGVIDDLKKDLRDKVVEINKLNAKIDTLTQLNKTYQEENRNLSRQLDITMTQNKELLQRALHDKDQYHLEMKDYQDQLSALRRHKEKLEDKIMDQYRAMDNKKSTPERKQPVVKRAAKALFNRRRATSNGGSTTEDSSVYSADERSSPPLANGNSTCSVSTSSESTSSTATSGVYTSPEDCPLHGSRSFSQKTALKLVTSSSTSSFSRILSLRRLKQPRNSENSILQGAYTNPNVRKMIDMHSSSNFYNCSD
ncbi:hypothetical protein CAEBREN_25494 [Caenorhabditis brenneri]|uniref:HOOK N-terminal domain-containing protein n=1 Tax=Caenorhabditis brenneri TaxID=135651 RepID=G0P074_CAEBE|nr:hypothetical protein CAEBREN_25494 [Caenorhabditis brenneri]